MACVCGKPAPSGVIDYANECASCVQLNDNGVLEVGLFEFSSITCTDEGLVADPVKQNLEVAKVYEAPKEPWTYGDAVGALRQSCTGELFMDAPGGWAGQYQATGSLASFQAQNEDTVCIPVACKQVCDTTDPLRLVFRGCVEIVGTWTASKLSNAKSATVSNTIQIFDADGSLSCEVQGEECIDFLGSGTLQTVRLANPYFISGCVDCDAGFNIRIESIQGTLGGDTIFLNDGFYRLNVEFFLLREC